MRPDHLRFGTLSDRSVTIAECGAGAALFGPAASDLTVSRLDEALAGDDEETVAVLRSTRDLRNGFANWPRWLKLQVLRACHGRECEPGDDHGQGRGGAGRGRQLSPHMGVSTATRDLTLESITVNIDAC